MRCEPFEHNGVVGFVCSSGRGARPRCSTPRCRRAARLECDAAVDRPHPDVPRRGDARLHREHRVIFYVWSVRETEVTVSTGAPGTGCARGVLQTVPLADWWAKTTATCDAALCEQCATRIGALDYCAAHAAEVRP